MKVKLPGQSFQVLLLLIRRRGEIVTRQELQNILWPQDTFVDFDEGLNAAVKKLRSALGDSALSPRFVETIPRHGYRFIAEVQELSVGDAATAQKAPVAQAAVADAGPRPAPAKPKRSKVVATALAIALLAAIILGWRYRWEQRRVAPGGRVMLAVLPFANLTGDTTQDYLSDGLTDELISQLGSFDPDRLGVIARTSVMRYKENRAPVDQIGRDLGVQYVLEGSVRRDAGAIRTTADLIRVDGQDHVWSREYDRELAHVLVLEGEIAREIAEQIEATFGDPNTRLSAHANSAPRSQQAYDLYLRGEYFFDKRTSFERAIQYYDQAIAIDPNFARAYAGKADCYLLIGGYSGLRSSEYRAKAREAALRALQLDDHLAAAHTAMARILEDDWDWAGAEKEFRRAIELDPNYATAHHWYGEYLGFQGRFDEAFREVDTAHQIDPLSLIIAADRGALLYFDRQYDRSIEQLLAVLEMDPQFARAAMVDASYILKGEYVKAITQLQGPNKSGSVSPWQLAGLARAYAGMGRMAEAKRTLRQTQLLNRKEPLDPGVYAAEYIGLGDKERALGWLEKCYAEHSDTMLTLKVEPLFDPLRGDPRFQDLLDRVGLGGQTRHRSTTPAPAS